MTVTARTTSPLGVTTTAVSSVMTPVRIGMPASGGRFMFGYALIRAITRAAVMPMLSRWDRMEAHVEACRLGQMTRGLAVGVHREHDGAAGVVPHHDGIVVAA